MDSHTESPTSTSGHACGDGQTTTSLVDNVDSAPRSISPRYSLVDVAISGPCLNILAQWDQNNVPPQTSSEFVRDDAQLQLRTVNDPPLFTGEAGLSTLPAFCPTACHDPVRNDEAIGASNARERVASPAVQPCHGASAAATLATETSNTKKRGLLWPLTDVLLDVPPVSADHHNDDMVLPEGSAKTSRQVEVRREDTQYKATSILANFKNRQQRYPVHLDILPNEILTHILGYLDVCDLLNSSRTNHHLRSLSLHPILHRHRLREARLSLPSSLFSPSRPTLAQLISKHIFLTHTTQISRRLARSLVSIRLSRRLPLRPTAETLVQRGVLPKECITGANGKSGTLVAPGLVARKRQVEREKVKDCLRGWVGKVWRGRVYERGEDMRKEWEITGVGRVWRLRRFWEHMGKGNF